MSCLCVAVVFCLCIWIVHVFKCWILHFVMCLDFNCLINKMCRDFDLFCYDWWYYSHKCKATIYQSWTTWLQQWEPSVTQVCVSQQFSAVLFCSGNIPQRQLRLTKVMLSRYDSGNTALKLLVWEQTVSLPAPLNAKDLHLSMPALPLPVRTGAESEQPVGALFSICQLQR